MVKSYVIPQGSSESNNIIIPTTDASFLLRIEVYNLKIKKKSTKNDKKGNKNKKRSTKERSGPEEEIESDDDDNEKVKDNDCRPVTTGKVRITPAEVLFSPPPTLEEVMAQVNGTSEVNTATDLSIHTAPRSLTTTAPQSSNDDKSVSIANAKYHQEEYTHLVVYSAKVSHKKMIKVTPDYSTSTTGQKLGDAEGEMEGHTSMGVDLFTVKAREALKDFAQDELNRILSSEELTDTNIITEEKLEVDIIDAIERRLLLCDATCEVQYSNTTNKASADTNIPTRSTYISTIRIPVKLVSMRRSEAYPMVPVIILPPFNNNNTSGPCHSLMGSCSQQAEGTVKKSPLPEKIVCSVPYADTPAPVLQEVKPQAMSPLSGRGILLVDVKSVFLLFQYSSINRGDNGSDSGSKMLFYKNLEEVLSHFRLEYKYGDVVGCVESDISSLVVTCEEVKQHQRQHDNDNNVRNEDIYNINTIRVSTSQKCPITFEIPYFSGEENGSEHQSHINSKNIKPQELLSLKCSLVTVDKIGSPIQPTKASKQQQSHLATPLGSIKFDVSKYDEGTSKAGTLPFKVKSERIRSNKGKQSDHASVTTTTTTSALADLVEYLLLDSNRNGPLTIDNSIPPGVLFQGAYGNIEISMRAALPTQSNSTARLPSLGDISRIGIMNDDTDTVLSGIHTMGLVSSVKEANLTPNDCPSVESSKREDQEREKTILTLQKEVEFPPQKEIPRALIPIINLSCQLNPQPSVTLSSPGSSSECPPFTPRYSSISTHTNVRVMARIRPFIAAIDTVPSKTSSSFHGDMIPHTECWSVTSNERGVITDEGKCFEFDHVFSQRCPNSEVFKWLTVGGNEGSNHHQSATVSVDILEEFMSGINGTLFVYGQTASGKTHTMFGHNTEENDEAEEGVVSMILRELYRRLSSIGVNTATESADSVNKNTRLYGAELKVSFYEIYNEEIGDLLYSPTNDGVTASSYHEIPVRVTADGSGFHAAVVERDALTFENCLSIIREGMGKKHMGESHLNNKSSRSHSILRLKLVMHNSERGGRDTLSELNFVDLAGSESLANIYSASKIRETTKINLSLSYLKKVIRELSTKERYVSYRNSVLTKMLKSSLGGNARSTLICCMSPAPRHQKESHETLKFGALAKTIVNNSHANVWGMPGGTCDDAEVKALNMQISALKERLQLLSTIDEDFKKVTADNQELRACIDRLLEDNTKIKVSESSHPSPAPEKRSSLSSSPVFSSSPTPKSAVPASMVEETRLLRNDLQEVTRTLMRTKRHYLTEAQQLQEEVKEAQAARITAVEEELHELTRKDRALDEHIECMKATLANQGTAVWLIQPYNQGAVENEIHLSGGIVAVRRYLKLVPVYPAYPDDPTAMKVELYDVAPVVDDNTRDTYTNSSGGWDSSTNPFHSISHYSIRKDVIGDMKLDGECNISSHSYCILEIPLISVTSMDLGQSHEHFSIALTPLKDDEGNCRATANMQLFAQAIRNHERTSFTLRYKDENPREGILNIVCATSLDFESWVVLMDKQSGLSPLWPTPMDLPSIGTGELSSELTPSEISLCANNHIRIEEYVDARDLLISTGGHGSCTGKGLSDRSDTSSVISSRFRCLTMLDIMNRTRLDLYHSRAIFLFFREMGWVASANVFYSTLK